MVLWQVLLTRLRMMEGPPYPYEQMLYQYNNQTDLVMCSYLPMYKAWNRTKGQFTVPAAKSRRGPF